MYNNNNSYEAYKQQSVMTMTHGEMLVKLYDEAVKQLGMAVRSIDDKDVPAANKALQKTQDILRYLDSTLNMQYDVSASLSALYDFFIRRTISANVSKDTTPLTEIIPMLQELRDAFTQAEKLSRMGQTTAAAATSRLMGAVG